MNLVTDHWIPVVMADGEIERSSLARLYEQREQIRDLACTPPQRIALMRLLICITQAALDGPSDDQDWWDCRERVAESSLAYLARWREAFNLRGDRPFLQIPGLEVDPGSSKPLDMLDCRLSSGNNPTLFDHEAVAEGREGTDEDIALNLVTFLNFSTGGKVGQANWHGAKYSHSTFTGPCLRYTHTFVRGANLLETVHLNLMTKSGEITGISSLPNGEWGRPVWESFPETVEDASALRNAAETYLGRLVPLSRFVNLAAGAPTQCIIGPTHKSYRISHLPAFREPWATVVDVKGEPRYMMATSSRHMWRQLESLLSLARGPCGATGSLSLANVATLYDALGDKVIDIWVGGLEAGAGGGKIIDTVEWCFSVPISQFGETQMNKYVTGVKLADDGEKALGSAVKAFFVEMKMDSRQIPYDHAKQRYWSILDGQCLVLLRAANDAHIHLGDTWYAIVRSAMKDAYVSLCTHETPRQIEASAKGQAKLRLRKPEE